MAKIWLKNGCVFDVKETREEILQICHDYRRDRGFFSFILDIRNVPVSQALMKHHLSVRPNEIVAITGGDLKWQKEER